MKTPNKTSPIPSQLGSYTSTGNYTPYYRNTYASSSIITYEDTIKNEIEKYEFQYNVEFISNIIRFFDFDYKTGEELLALVKTGDPDNNKMAIFMLFGGVKEQIKKEIIAEIFK